MNVMPTDLHIPARRSRRGEPVWELLDRLPEQGRWSEAAYLRLDRKGIEFKDGCLEVLPVPDAVHQMLVFLLCQMLSQFVVDGQRGRALPAGFKLKVPRSTWREPDVVYLAPKNEHRHRREWWDYADLAIEIVSPDDPRRDYHDKREDYAATGVPEYWIIDPQHSTFTVLVLDDGMYRDAQVAREGDQVHSPTLPGLRVDVTQMFTRARA